MKKSVSHSYVVGKGRIILIYFLDICKCSLVMYQNLTSDNFLKFSCDVEFETSEFFELG